MYRKKMTYCRWLAFLLFFSAMEITAQQVPIYSQYFMNRFLVNPARTGAYGYTDVNLTAREQWVGHEGAPRTYALAFQTRLLKTNYAATRRSPRRSPMQKSMAGNVGIGGAVFSDRSGIMNTTGVQGSYAYHIRLRNYQLSFGLTAAVFQYSLAQENIILYDKYDALLDNTNHTFYVPDATVGVYMTNNEMYAGLSSTQLFQSAIRFGNVHMEEARMERYYYLIGGYYFKISHDYDIEPSFLFKTNDALYSQLDINVRGIYMDRFWAGISYRTGNKRLDDIGPGGALILLAGVSVDKLNIGYAFDYYMNNIQKYSYGSHEIVLSLQFGDNARRYRWLDRF